MSEPLNEVPELETDDDADFIYDETDHGDGLDYSYDDEYYDAPDTLEGYEEEEEGEEVEEESVEEEEVEEEDEETVLYEGEEDFSYEPFDFGDFEEIDPTLLEEFEDLAFAADLSQDMAQEFIDLQLRAMERATSQSQDDFSELMDEWIIESKTDKEIGGKDFDQKMGIAREALSRWGTGEFKEVINNTGLGNNPEFLRFLYRVGKDLKEDSLHVGGFQREERDVAKILFPDMN